MFCPSCKDEFRPGFTRCASCDVDLVDDLASAAEQPAGRPSQPPPPAHLRMVEYCGFFALDDAREARNGLRAAGLIADILIRESPDAEGDGLAEEYWLRVEKSHYQRASAIVGFEQADETISTAAAEDSFACSACGQVVATAEKFCPGCGLRFEES